MDKNLPDKWIRKEISELIDGIEVDGETIRCYDYRATGVNIPDGYVLMSVQSNEVDKANKCEYFWDSEILLDIITIYNLPGNTGSRLFADNIADAVRDAIKDIQLDATSELEIINRTMSFPNDLNTVGESKIVFRKFLRLQLKIKDAIPIDYNFDVTANWNLTLNSRLDPAPVTDETTFREFLTNGFTPLEVQNDFTNIVITDFDLTNGRLRCNLSADCTTFSIDSLEATSADKVGILTGLSNLSFYNNQLTKFNPTTSLPITLTFILLNSNLITTAGWTEMEEWANLQTAFTATCSIPTGSNTNTAIGTNFETLIEAKNSSVT